MVIEFMKKFTVLIMSVMFMALPAFSQTYNEFYEFGAGINDPYNPDYDAPLIVGNTIFGSTYSGGPLGWGSIYKMNLDGTGFTVLHDFLGGSTEGAAARGRLIISGNTIYGVTNQGGSGFDGVLFSIDTLGNNYTILHHFDSFLNDPGQPYEGVILYDNKLFGMGSLGGSVGFGGIYYFDLDDNSFHVIHSFSGPPSDGSTPNGRLLLIGNTLFGMTLNGGANGGNPGNGIIFKIDTSGANFTVIHDFAGQPNDGLNPSGGLIYVNGMLYGMSGQGGLNNSGAIFRIDTLGGNFELLHSFDFGADFNFPFSDLIFVGNKLFGLTPSGGAQGDGGIFVLDTNGSNYARLAELNNANTSQGPTGSLTFYNHTLYGNKYSGGTYSGGVAFSYTVSLPTVTTSAVSGIGGTTATGNANVTDTGFSAVTTRGIVWNTSGSPTLSDNVSSETGTFGNGVFSRALSSLTPETMYHVRAFAVNDMGTSYGNEVTFTTIPLPRWALLLFGGAMLSIGIFVIYRKFYA